MVVIVGLVISVGDGLYDIYVCLVVITRCEFAGGWVGFDCWVFVIVVGVIGWVVN